ncbi:hypothetical protein BC938DRAFT_478981 [Jimgerdemannia flammicorona]|uniref:Acyl-CoA dehydrogenase/oxidase N-terminal domain-containing protein n=1 Tax=Jimgerdemannia flammicorona TaxID=994334 RepID=A0A433QLY1_9FUNG|nr:hypothetical protein BC938DRAFT_478981 [Jimgerdemannia flammicorona]
MLATLAKSLLNRNLRQVPRAITLGLQQRRGYAATTTYNTAVAGLTAEQAEFRQAVEEFAQKELAPRAVDIDRNNAFPMVR